jgi:hypothetical protein
LKQDFWRRWSSEYLQQLQNRYKWHEIVPVQIDQLVIIIEDNVPSSQWLLGKIVKLHPGKDNITRVVTVKTKSGELVRAIAKLCFVPLDDNTHQ